MERRNIKHTNLSLQKGSDWGSSYGCTGPFISQGHAPEVLEWQVYYYFQGGIADQ